MDQKEAKSNVKIKLTKVKTLSIDCDVQEDRYNTAKADLEQVRSIQFGEQIKSTAMQGKELIALQLERKDKEELKLIEVRKDLSNAKEELKNYLKNIDDGFKYRVMFNRYVLLYSYKEIAKKLDVSLPTVKNSINRSINKLIEIELSPKQNETN